MTHRILVVDDEPDITALVAYHLAKAGYHVSTASDGTGAIRAAQEQRPDLVVLDLMLPGASGYQVLETLRQRPETRDVGVIVLTARKDEADRIQGLSLGADDYLVKPFSPQELVLRVGAVLRRLSAPAVSSGSVVVAGPLPVVPQEQPLEAELHALRVVGVCLGVGDRAVLVVNRGGTRAVELHQIDARDHAEIRRGERERARSGRPLDVGDPGFGDLGRGLGIHPAMREAALDRVEVVVPLALDPLKVGEPRAVDVLVDHAGREEVR